MTDEIDNLEAEEGAADSALDAELAKEHAEESGPGRGALPVVAIVGRPNVGKSRIFNRLTGGRDAIVMDIPGVTRDRNYGRAEFYGKWFTVIDTGGFEPESEDRLLEQMREQATLAIEEADVIMFVVDGRAGRLPGDELIAQILRQTNKPVFVAVNKLDTPTQGHASADFYPLGLEHLYSVSAEHGVGFADLIEEITEFFPERAQATSAAKAAINVAVVGKPNAGKSTLVNRLLGADRLLTSDIPGTTRDSIDTLIERGDQKFLMIDTAGMRRKRSVSRRLEKYSVVQAVKSIERADVVLLVIDATEGVTDQDAKIAGLAVDRGASMAILLNKWDAIENKDSTTAGAFVHHVRDRLAFMQWAPILTLSALTGQRSHKVLDLVTQLHETSGFRVPTGEFNRLLETWTHRHKIPSKGGREVKIYYGSQVAVRPPTFVLQSNQPRGVTRTYRRYLLNQLRATFDFEGAPIRMKIKKPRGRRKYK